MTRGMTAQLVCLVLFAAVSVWCVPTAAGEGGADAEAVAGLFELLVDADPASAGKSLETLAGMQQTGQLSAAQAAALKKRLGATLSAILAKGPDDPLHIDAAVLQASWGGADGLAAAKAVYADAKRPEGVRLRAFEAVVASGDGSALAAASHTLGDPDAPAGLKGRTLGALGRLSDPAVAGAVLAAYPALGADLQPKAVGLLTQRSAWAVALVDAVERKAVAPGAVNINQVQKLQATAPPDLAKRIRKIWGAVRSGRNPDRERVIREVRALVLKAPGDPVKGMAVFGRVCAQCHVIYGQGNAIGPDLTGNGRGSFEQLLSNVLDPNLVIGDAYQMRTVLTHDGRALAGMLAEQVARILGTTTDRLDTRRSMLDLGLDSLMGVELRNWVEEGLGLTLPTVEVMRGPSVEELAGLLVDFIRKN